MWRDCSLLIGRAGTCQNIGQAEAQETGSVDLRLEVRKQHASSKSASRTCTVHITVGSAPFESVPGGRYNDSKLSQPPKKGGRVQELILEKRYIK